jgi:apolipoprotein N-acyltransferase
MRIGLAVAVLAAVAAFAAGAWSAAPPSPAEKKLQRDVKALQGQVKTLRGDVKKLKARETNTEDLTLGVLVFAICSTVITADALQGTWQVTDQLSAATQAGKTYFPPQVPVNDLVGGQSVCQALGVPRTQTLPPSTASFTALVALFQGAALLRQGALLGQTMR